MNLKTDRVLLAHGAGGKMSQALTERIFLKYFDDPALLMLNDYAVFEVPGGRIAMSTDTYTIDPIFFPGGDIGSLAVHGTVNDVAMSGAIPIAISTGFILEEGLLLEDLEIIAGSMSAAAGTAGVRIVTADTKVVPRGSADRIFINTTGIGIIPAGCVIGGQEAKPGDVILLSGTIGDHGIAVASSREGIRFSTVVSSDSASLNSMVSALVRALGDQVHVLRDPTRGGLATVLNEISVQSNVGIRINEEAIPVREGVKGACELLGYDPLYLANEGKLVAIVAPEAADNALRVIRSDPLGGEAAIIGEVVRDHPRTVVMNTPLGGHRLVDRLSGEMLPRIC
ncbi:MAG: hydrogenase expression/formation protein HypE [Deltaproteobacteria bacterium]|nr:hydrogenase expression/formation protein HypE [Deltaproteobacteria bacterium]